MSPTANDMYPTRLRDDRRTEADATRTALATQRMAPEDPGARLGILLRLAAGGRLPTPRTVLDTRVGGRGVPALGSGHPAPPRHW